MNQLTLLAVHLGIPFVRKDEEGYECELVQLVCTEEGIQALYTAPIKEITGTISEELH